MDHYEQRRCKSGDVSKKSTVEVRLGERRMAVGRKVRQVGIMSIKPQKQGKEEPGDHNITFCVMRIPRERGGLEISE